jgi:acetylornithine/succinyldiaminopimelate/putrescine aminotransferase
MKGHQYVDAADGCCVVAQGFEDPYFFDALAMEGRQKGLLQKFIDPFFLLGVL